MIFILGLLSVSRTMKKHLHMYVAHLLEGRYTLEECANCVQTIIRDGIEEFNTFIILRSRGHLSYPSDQLITLLQDVELLIAKNTWLRNKAKHLTNTNNW